MIYTHLAAALAAGAVAFYGGWQVRAWKSDADELAQQQSDAKAAYRRAERVDSAATGHEATRASLQRQDAVLVKEIERVVEKPVYRFECIDADGLRIIAAALSGAPDSGEPAPAVPDPGPTD